jgi:hypothetical protein
MVKYTCETCKAEFNFIAHFQDHIASPTACEKFLDKLYDCDHCDKKYTSEKAKKYHMKTSCKKNPLLHEIEKIKKELEESKKEIEESKNKIKQLETQNKNNITNNIGNNSNNTNNTNIQNNTINQNITIDFGNEDISLLEFKEKMSIIKKCYDSIVECIRLTHCNDRLPEQKNIKLSNLRSKFAKKMNDGKFETISMDELLEDTIFNRADDVKTILEEYKKKIPENTIIKIEDLLFKVETRDKLQIKKEKEKAKLLLYNDYIQNK